MSWYDAREYCRWLTKQLRAWEGIPESLAGLVRDQGWKVRLPTETGWKKAARGTDGRLFAWGDKADPNWANYFDTGIGKTCAVGCFPGGASPYGVLDLSGNVFEWCCSSYKSYPYRADDGHEDESAVLYASRVLRDGVTWLNPAEGGSSLADFGFFTGGAD